MTILKFAIDGVRTLCAHAIKSPAHDVGYGDPASPRPQLIFVKDEGIYLMSNGRPALLRNTGGTNAAARDAPPHVVVYAEDFDPATRDRDAVWRDAAAAVGGDDFAEYLDFMAIQKTIDHPAARWFVVEVTAKSLTYYVSRE